MSSSFQSLIDALVHLLNAQAVRAEPGPDGAAQAELFVKDERFLLVHTDAHCDGFMVYAEFGEVPRDRALACLQRILEINLAQAGEGRAGFGLAPGGETLVYAINASLSNPPSSLLRAFVHVAEQIKVWRENHFLCEHGPSPQVDSSLLRA